MSHSLSLVAKPLPGQSAILTEEALAFVAELVRTFRPRVR